MMKDAKMTKRIIHITAVIVTLTLCACSSGTGGADIPLIPVPEAGKF
jgi:hypothetical protein